MAGWTAGLHALERDLPGRPRVDGRGHAGWKARRIGGHAEPGLGGATLAELGVGEADVRESIERIIGRGRTGQSAALGITPRTKRVFEGALKEAKRVGSQRCADPEHLLLALASGDGVAGDILAEFGAGEEAIRAQLATLLEREAPEIAARLRAPKRRGVRRRSRA